MYHNFPEKEKTHLLQVSLLLMLLIETFVSMSLISLKCHNSKLLKKEQYKKCRLKLTAEELGWSTRNSTNWAKRKEGGLVSRSCMLQVTKMNVHEMLLSICAIISHTKNKIVFSDMLTEVPLVSVRITCLHLRAEFGPKSLVRTLCWNPTENKGFQRTMRIKLM